jgi:predicted transcriptional regulator YdeE
VISAPTVKLGHPRIRDVDPMRLSGLSGDFTPDTMREIGSSLWPRFVGQLRRVRLSGAGGKVSWGAGFHCFDDSPRFQYLCAVEVSDLAGVPEGWARLEYGEAFDPASGTGDLEVWFPIRP